MVDMFLDFNTSWNMELSFTLYIQQLQERVKKSEFSLRFLYLGGLSGHTYLYCNHTLGF